MIIIFENNYFFGSDYFCLLNIFIFGLTNGYATNALMSLAPKQLNDEEKEIGGFLMSFPLFFGILCGSMIALTYQNL